MNKTIQDLIEFAIKNELTQNDLNGDELIINDEDYRIEWGEFDEGFSEDIGLDDKITIWTGNQGQTYAICHLIMSLKFIEAIARGIIRKGYKEIAFGNLEDDITTKQAMAIRDSKIDEFITEILTND